jgi:hypothetical protein
VKTSAALIDIDTEEEDGNGPNPPPSEVVFPGLYMKPSIFDRCTSKSAR